MKLSKKLRSKIKKRTLQTLASIALVLTTLAIFKLADFSVPLSKILNNTFNNNAEETSIDAKSISSGIEKSIYIDANNGNDETGDGSEGAPFATLNKIIETGYIIQNVTYNIYLQDGVYSFPEYYGMINLNCNKSINIYGNKEKTILQLPYSGIGSNSGGGGNRN